MPDYGLDRPSDPRPIPRPPDHRYASSPPCPVPGPGNAAKCLSDRIDRYVSDDWCDCVCHTNQEDE